MPGPLVWLTAGRGRVARRFAMVAGASAAAQGVLLAATPAITRLYPPEDFGALAVFSACFALLVTVITLQYEQAIPVAAGRGERAHLLVLAMGSAVTQSAGVMLLAPVLLALAPAGCLPAGAAGQLALLGPCCVAAGASLSLQSVAVRAGRFSGVSAARLTQALARAGCVVGLGLLGVGSVGLVLALIVGHLASVGCLAASLRGPAGRVRLSWRGLRRAARRHASLPKYFAPSALLSACGGSIPLLLMPPLFGPAAAGLFAMAGQLTMWPVVLVGRSLGQAFYAETCRPGVAPTRVRQLFYRVSACLAAIAALLSVVLATAPWWASTLLGGRWSGVGYAMAALVPQLATRLISSPLVHAHHLYRTQHVYLGLETLKAVVAVAAIAASWAAGVPFTTTLLVYSLATGATYLLDWFVLLLLVRQAAPEHEAGPAARAARGPAPASAA